MNSLNVKIMTVSPNATIPTYQTDGAAGMDLHACLDYRGDDLPRGIVVPEWTCHIMPRSWMAIHTGIRLAIPAGFEGQVRSRSGLAARHGISVLNSPGTIDSDFRGELIVVLYNAGLTSFAVKHGDRIAQIVFAPVTRANLIREVELDGTARGAGGFGSTGI